MPFETDQFTIIGELLVRICATMCVYSLSLHLDRGVGVATGRGQIDEWLANHLKDPHFAEAVRTCVVSWAENKPKPSTGERD